MIIFSNVTISELRQFVSSIYCEYEYPCCGWSSFDIPLKTEAESEDDDIECEYTMHWGAGHQGPAEAGTVPLGLVAAPTPFSEAELSVLALAASMSRDDNNNTGNNGAALETEGELPSPVSASRDCGSVPAVSVSEAGVTSPMSEKGAGHQGPAEAGIVPLGLVAAPVPALSDIDCVLAESAEEEAAVEFEAGVTSPVLERGAGHQGPAEAGIVPLGLVAAPIPAFSGDSDCVLAMSPQPSTSSQPEQSPDNPVIFFDPFPVLKCDVCGKECKNKDQLGKHKMSHLTQQCSHCGKVLKQHDISSAKMYERNDRSVRV